VGSRPRIAGRSRRTLILLVLASITALTLDARGSSVVDGLRSRVADLMRPVTDAFGSLFSPVEDVWNGVFRYNDLEKENAKLREQLDTYKGREAVIAGSEAEMQRLYALVNLPFAADIPSSVANVIGGRPSNFDQTIQLDRGSADGVKVGYPVVTGGGLVGRVERVSRHSCFVRLLDDPAFTAGVTIGADNSSLLVGQGTGQPLLVELANKPRLATTTDSTSTTGPGGAATTPTTTTAVSTTSAPGSAGQSVTTIAAGASVAGDASNGKATNPDDTPVSTTTTSPESPVITRGMVVLTSGLDVSLYPKGIPVGTVTKVVSPPGSGNLAVTVAPSVDLGRLSVVKILLYDPPDARP
jgi:rod shape-determining protein MreC